MSISAMKQAIEVFNLISISHMTLAMTDPPQPSWKVNRVDEKITEAKSALRQAIAEAEKPKMRRATREEKIVNPGVYEVPIHSLPYPMQEGKDFTVSKPWVGLTVEEIDDIWKTEVFDAHYGIARMVEAKLKEKNT